MSDFISSKKKLGILGGGQLGKMFIQSASRYDVHCAVLDPTENCPASSLADEFTHGAFTDYDTVLAFGADKDILTIEIENVNVDALKQLQKQGKKVFPQPEIIELIKDKGLQKTFYKENNIASSPFDLYGGPDEIKSALDKGIISIPFVQKSRTEGYDGRGVAVIKSESDLEKLLPGKSLVENQIEIYKEISVIISRNEQGDMNHFDPVEMVFSEEANLVELLFSPSNLTEKQTKEVIALGEKVMSSLELVGVLAIELFLTKSGELLVNEVAPRPHNSGHHTIEANKSSQYDQHLRAIIGFPLGENQSTSDAVMINLLGEKEHTGPVFYQGIDEALNSSYAQVHIYGKKETKPFRKMGHITFYGGSLTDLLEDARNVKKMVKVISKTTEE